MRNSPAENQRSLEHQSFKKMEDMAHSQRMPEPKKSEEEFIPLDEPPNKHKKVAQELIMNPGPIIEEPKLLDTPTPILEKNLGHETNQLKEEQLEEKEVKREVSPFNRTTIPKMPVQAKIPFKPGMPVVKRAMPVAGNPFNKPKTDSGNFGGEGGI